MGLGLDQPSHWAIIAVAALLLFGYKKLPEMARSAGKSMRIFKTEIKGMAGDDEARDHQPVAAPVTQVENTIAPAPVAVAPIVQPPAVVPVVPVIPVVAPEAPAEPVPHHTN